MSTTTIAVMIAAALLLLLGCERPPPPPAPPKTDPVMERLADLLAGGATRVTIHEYDVEDGGESEGRHAAAAFGPSLRTTSDSAAQSFDAESAAIALPGGVTLNGGGVSIQNDLISQSGINPFYLLGGLLLVAALALAWLKRARAAVIAELGAAGSIAVAVTIETAPVLWVWLLVACAGVAGVWVWSEWRRGRAERDGASTFRALRAVTAAVDSAPDDAAREVKSRVRPLARQDHDIEEAIERSRRG